MGDTPSAPPPSQQELDLQSAQASLLKQQTSILQQQNANYNLLAPYIYQQFGLTPQTDKTGNITGFTQDPAFAQNQKLGQQAETLSLNNEIDALEGKLPINSAVEATLNQNQADLESNFSNAMGPGYKTSTGYINALNKFLQYRTGIEQAAQSGQLSLASQLAAAGAGTANNISGGGSSGIQGTSALPLSLISGGGTIGQGFSAAINPFLAQQQMGLSASIAGSQQTTAELGGAGMLAGTAIMAIAL